MLAAFREPLQAALAGPQDAERPRTYAAAEVLAGLLASGALFAADAGACLSVVAGGVAKNGRIAAYPGNPSLNTSRSVPSLALVTTPDCKVVWLRSGL